MKGLHGKKCGWLVVKAKSTSSLLATQQWWEEQWSCSGTMEDSERSEALSPPPHLFSGKGGTRTKEEKNMKWW